MRGLLNLFFGVLFIYGGLGGDLVLIGTNSGGALAAVGVVLVLVGLARMFGGSPEPDA